MHQLNGQHHKKSLAPPFIVASAAKVILAVSFLILLATSAMAAQITLAWDANEPTPDGYRLYQRSAGESFDYDQPVWTGSTTTAPIDDLTEGLTYYFVVRAYVGSDESGDSNEVEYTPPVEDQSPVNQAPSANAGSNQTALSEAMVTLNGTGSDPDGDTLSYAWVQTSGPAVSLSNATGSACTFTAPTLFTGSAVLTFTLTVTDPSGAQDSDQCRITVEAPAPVNQAPVANAGSDRTVQSEDRVTLNGTGSSDPDGDSLSYSWVQTSGPTVALSDATRSWFSFYAPTVSSNSAVLVFTLTVTDPSGAQDSDQCRITVEAPAPVNQAPVANAGSDRTVHSEDRVTLNGTGADPDGDSLSYSWVQSSGPAVVLSTVSQSSFSFSAPTVSSGSAVLVFTLTVTDPSGAQDSDQCRITVEAPAPVNQAPVANAGGDQTVPSEALVTLNGTGSSDPDGDTLSYSWIQTSGPAVVLSTMSQSSFSFSAPTVSSDSAVLVFTLTVMDPSGSQCSDQCRITVEAPAPVNQTPVANAGPNQTVDGQGQITLDGSGSYDPEGPVLDLPVASDQRPYGCSFPAGQSSNHLYLL